MGKYIGLTIGFILGMVISDAIFAEFDARPQDKICIEAKAKGYVLEQCETGSK